MQLFHVLRQNVETGRLFLVQIEVFAVNADNARCILRLFHSAFDFEGHNPGFYNLRQQFYRTHILRA